jgi:hypothetical protein
MVGKQVFERTSEAFFAAGTSQTVGRTFETIGSRSVIAIRTSNHTCSFLKKLRRNT